MEKSIVYIHGCEVESINQRSQGVYRLLGLNSRFNRLLFHCKSIVFVSEFIKDEFLNEIDKDVSKSILNKSIVINNGVDRNNFTPMEAKPRNEINIVTASRLIKEKGHLNLLNGLRKMLNERPNYNWLILGDGDESFISDLNNEIFNSNLENKIKFLGRVDRSKLPEVYSNCDIFILLSNFDEAHPMVYMEAAACGLPSIAWNKGGCRESIVHGKTGYLIDDIDDLEGACDSALNLSREGIVNGAESFDINISVNKLIEILGSTNE